MRTLFYFFSTLLMFGLSRGIKRKHRFFDMLVLCAIAAIPAIFSICLPYEISDRAVYADRYLRYYPRYIENIVGIFTQTSTEYGFALYNLILYLIIPDPKFLLFTSAFITNFCILYAFYKLKDYRIDRLVLVYILTWYPFFSFYGIRQSLAMGFGSIAISEYVRCKNIKNCWKKVFVWMLLAMCFHGTAIIIAFFIGICEFVKGKRRITTFIIILTGMFWATWPILNWVLSWPIFESKFLGSRDVETVSAAIALKGIPMLLAGLTGLLYRNRLYAKDKAIDICIVGTIFFGFMWIYAINGYWLYRLNFYGIILFCFLMCSIEKNIANQKFAKLSYLLSMIAAIIVVYRELILYMKIIFI